MSSSTASQVRSAFLDFFRGKHHEVVPSAPIVPQNDPTLMFTNAGMVPFKDVFTGKDTRSYRRATSSQKCIRISGKHNDLENVGVTARHHTFFEMLGNFSFGDYFKEEAIAYAWELLTKTYAIPKDRMCITVFGGDPEAPSLGPDDEARAIWRKVTGWGDDRILGLGLKDNFWQMGDTGPCGPCTEIHFHLGGPADLSTFGEEPGPDGRGWMEIWNLVFMQFERSLHNGAPKLAPLPRPCVDTGAGLERMASVLQGKTTNYDTDLLRALVDKAASIAGKPYRGTLDDDDVSMRVIADHARTTAFLVAEGIFPDRAGREYVLRRVMRRAIRHGHRLGIRKPFLHEVALEVVRLMADAYPELATRKGVIASVTEDEEVRFRETIERGLNLLEKNKSWRDENGKRVLPGATAFKLYDTFGFPLDLTEVIGRERGFEVDDAGFEAAMEEQRKRSEGSKLHDEAEVQHVFREALGRVAGGAVRFIGYDHEAGEGTVLAIVRGTELVAKATAGETVSVVLDETPFYAESGGQVGDTGALTAPGVRVDVTDVQKPLAGLLVHHGTIESGAVSVGDRLHAAVNRTRRSATRRNHSATHLLHYALRTVLGEQATQKGSLVGPDRLRFDFAHGRAVTAEEIARIEDLVNAKILENAPIETAVMPIDEARKAGAIAMFGEKYGDTVRVLTMTKDSVELCGGTHARALGDIGLFKILSEGGVAAGVRRIEAATGLNALAYLRQLEKSNVEAARALGAPGADVPARIEKLQTEKKAVDKELADLKRKVALGGAGGGAGGGLDEMVRAAREVPGGKALALRTESGDAATLRELAEKLRDKLGPSVVLVGSAAGGKASLVIAVSKELTGTYKAGELIKKVAQVVGGSGGGRADMAQAGGPGVEKLDDALDGFYATVS